ncbi:MAG: hypothetical protein LBN28_02995 [Desulfovibrio sp.]|nr:hypothetical protein [Desulfovibrio sp.]
MQKLFLLLTVFMLCLFEYSGVYASANLEEKQYAPPTSSPVTPSLDVAPDVYAVPQTPTREGDVIVIPPPPERHSMVPNVPEQDKSLQESEKESSVKTPADFLPTAEPDRTVAEPQQQREPESKEKEKNALLTPADFLLLTPNREQEKKESPLQKEPQPKKEVPPKQYYPKLAQKPQHGDPLKIPEDAAKTGKLDFLEGCWRGTRPEYGTKRIVTERFCFNANGVGKRFILDPQFAGECVGATRAVINSGGVLRMRSDKMYCTPSGSIWGGSEMTCRGEGNRTPCSWVFTDIKNTRQAYTINFVRE